MKKQSYKKTITYEDVILKNKLYDNKYQEAYLKCVKYISIRLRSQVEIEKYLTNKGFDEEIIIVVIQKLNDQQLLDDKRFAIAFTHDKFKFSVNGPYLIKQELKQHKIDDDIIDEAISTISNEEIEFKINKLIQKQLKSNEKMDFKLKNKIYNRLINLGFEKSSVLMKLNEY